MPIIGPDGDQHSTEKRFYHAAAASRRYFKMIYKLGRDIFRQSPTETIRILLSSGASLSCQVFALAALFTYARALESNELLFGYAPRESLQLFTAVALITLILFFVFALLEYRSNIATLGLCRRYQNLGTQEALSLSSRLPHWFVTNGGEHISDSHLRQIISTDVHHRSRLARILLLAVIPASRLLLCTAALLFINPQFSTVIFLVVGIPVLGLYSVGRKIADTITSKETGRDSIFQQQQELLAGSWSTGSGILHENIDWETSMGQADSGHRLYFRRLKARELGKLLLNTASILGIMVVVIALGFWISTEQQDDWSLWITYLVALRYFLSSLKKVAQLVIQSTRFNRQVRRFLDFIEAASFAVNSLEPLAVACPDHVAKAYKGAMAKLGSNDDFDDD